MTNDRTPDTERLRQIPRSRRRKPIAPLTVAGLIQLAEDVRELGKTAREVAEVTGTKGAWGAVEFIETASRTLHGAAGFLSLDEKEVMEG